MNRLPMFCALAISLAGCAAGGAQQSATHLSAAQCRDLTALRNHAPLTRERNLSELAALEKAGYDPSRFYDPYYPDDLHAAQRQVEIWYRTDCQPQRVD
ncbi:hypothetical protein AWB70_04425 [Caballeronia cordobensis]|uniref:DUF4148 domain-containing protein n=1 Tax=Caballeronia cordobensis TaxID=1353886 RepID=A0A158I9G7_CABCO|nr:DUF4148 domain-containing protein [Caballeronia cordobensis]SAL53228.1 hypothetical protein AWB70_04425 [Caballeronia cordobensis]